MGTMSNTESVTGTPTGTGLDFVRDLVRADIEAGTFGGRVQTRETANQHRAAFEQSRPCANPQMKFHI